MLPTDLLQYKKIFTRYADFKYYKVNQLERIAYFMSLKPMTGFNTINNILKMFRLPQVPISAPVINILASMLIRRELNMYFGRIRKEDEGLSLDFDGLE